ncbi:MAG: class I SAM-dependent methyltransferase [Bdellovibrionales bacterium]|nr:class I SAM-dependent methyltransferase [Bdellovibrionales bacterium]
MTNLEPGPNSQKAHYEKIHQAYAEHYYDEFSDRYRDRFFFRYLFRGLDLNNKKIGDLCCGDGINSLAVKRRFPKADLTGFDISPTAVATYRVSLNSEAYELDLTQPIGPEFVSRFDYLICVGGLHHCVANLPQTVANIENLLKPGGRLLTVEPYSGTVLNSIRNYWYKRDPYFDETSERAIAPTELTTENLRVEKLAFGGGPAYYLIFNSLIFRLSKPVKKALFYPLMALEGLIQIIMPQFIAAVFLARYVRR